MKKITQEGFERWESQGLLDGLDDHSKIELATYFETTAEIVLHDSRFSNSETLAFPWIRALYSHLGHKLDTIHALDYFYQLYKKYPTLKQFKQNETGIDLEYEWITNGLKEYIRIINA